MNHLFAWQMPLKNRMVDTLRTGRIFICGAATGTGKTYLALATIKDLQIPALVICPKIARSQWRKAAEAMGCQDLIVDVVNPEQISKPSGCRFYTRTGGWQIPAGCLVVCDEFHRYGCADDANSKHLSHSARALISLHDATDAKLLVLSATLSETPFKFRVLGRWLDFFYNREGFIHWLLYHGCGYESRGRFGSALVFSNYSDDIEFFMTKIRDEMGDKFLSLSAEAVPDFPAEHREVRFVTLREQDRQAMVEAYAAMPREDDLTAAAQIRRMEKRQQAELCKALALADLAEAIIAAGRSAFIAVNFRRTLELFLGEMKRRELRCAHIIGGQEEAERQAQIEAFQSNEAHALVATMGAGGVSLSLHDALHSRPRVALISPGYSASELVQAIGRIRRVGGTDARVEIVIAAGTVEERVGRRLQRKISGLDALNAPIVDADLVRE